MRLAIDLVVAINAVAGLLGLLVRRRVRQNRVSNVEHVAQLEAENRRMDESLERMRGGGK